MNGPNATMLDVPIWCHPSMSG